MQVHIIIAVLLPDSRSLLQKKPNTCYGRGIFKMGLSTEEK